jgi:hypothetical protein
VLPSSKRSKPNRLGHPSRLPRPAEAAYLRQVPFVPGMVSRAGADRGGSHKWAGRQVAGFAVQFGEAGFVTGLLRGVDVERFVDDRGGA